MHLIKRTEQVVVIAGLPQKYRVQYIIVADLCIVPPYNKLRHILCGFLK